MPIRAFMIGLAALAVASAAAPAAVLITDDEGGRIGTYIDKFTQIRNSAENVVVDGDCNSACTLVVGFIPRERICFTARGRLGFHAAWTPGFLGIRVFNEEGSRKLWSLYPDSIRAWIVRRGGLTDRVIYLEGAELNALYPRCPQNFTARSATR